MKIAFVAPFGLGKKTTVWARTLPLAKELARLGHEVKILIPPWDTPADSGKQWSDDTVTVVNVSLHGGVPVTIFRLLHELRQFQPQIIHIVKPRAHAGIVQWLMWYFGFWWGRSTFQNPKSKICLDIDDWEQAWEEINHYPWLVAKFLAWQEEWGIRHADGITAASRWLEAQAKRYSPQTPVLYLPNGVVMGENRKGERTGDWQFKILFLTRYVEVEPEWFAQLLSSLHAKTSYAKLIVAGEPLQSGRDQLFREAVGVTSDSSIDSHQVSIAFLGKVTPQQIHELYTIVDCAIFPSAKTVLQQAKCSVRLATTLLHGVPVVASAVGEQLHYGAQGAARLVDANATAEEFADATVALLLDPQAQQEMIVQARQHLSHNYQWPQLGQTLDNWYRELKG